MLLERGPKAHRKKHQGETIPKKPRTLGTYMTSPGMGRAQVKRVVKTQPSDPFGWQMLFRRARADRILP